LSDARPPSVPVIGLVFTHEEHVLLQKANVPGPYVMAGESWGGGFARLYAYTYPAEVAGLVLIDAVNENELDNNELVSATPAFAAARTQLHMYTPKGIQGTLGTLPVAVLSENTRLPACGDCMEPAWSGYQAQLASASSNTVHVVGLRSGHVMSFDQPALVVEAVREVVAAVRTPSRMLPACGTAFEDLGGECIQIP
jgi:pimeloyl-ACP methyl ester carboxylesterase